ncbi:MAG: hypothetical protein HY211_03020 [Candidatus Omnitrophica bacterium]|nr:hypothetical protein [Candidatus Omnitrophota bacterium]
MRRIMVASGLVMGLGVVPMAVWAVEHGGTTLGGGKEHGGTAVPAEGSHGMPEADEATLLREAASALRKGQARPDLAAKLEKLAKEHIQK